MAVKNCSLSRDSGTGLTMNLRPAECTTWAVALEGSPGGEGGGRGLGQGAQSWRKDTRPWGNELIVTWEEWAGAGGRLLDQVTRHLQRDGGGVSHRMAARAVWRRSWRCPAPTCPLPSFIPSRSSPLSSAISMTSRTCSMNDSRSHSRINSLVTCCRRNRMTCLSADRQPISCLSELQRAGPQTQQTSYSCLGRSSLFCHSGSREKSNEGTRQFQRLP